MVKLLVTREPWWLQRSPQIKEPLQPIAWLFVFWLQQGLTFDENHRIDSCSDLSHIILAEITVDSHRESSNLFSLCWSYRHFKLPFLMVYICFLKKSSKTHDWHLKKPQSPYIHHLILCTFDLKSSIAFQLKMSWYSKSDLLRNVILASWDKSKTLLQAPKSLSYYACDLCNLWIFSYLKLVDPAG